MLQTEWCAAALRQGMVILGYRPQEEWHRSSFCASVSPLVFFNCSIATPSHACSGPERHPLPGGGLIVLVLSETGRGCHHTVMFLQNFLLRVWAWEQKGSGPCALTALTAGGTALSSGARLGTCPDHHAWKWHQPPPKKHLPSLGSGFSKAKLIAVRDARTLPWSWRWLAGGERSCRSSLRVGKQGRLLCYK